MADNNVSIGVVSCSGEDCLGGTISRLAVRKMMDEIRPDETVTICLPLYLAGGEEERSFAKDYPTIAVDGCSKCCAKRATEKYSGSVSAALDISEIIGKEKAEEGPLSTRDLTDEHKEMVNKVAREVRIKFDDMFNDYLKNIVAKGLDKSGKSPSGGCGCGCK
jgi:uncharacterized metal-binding protein